MGILSGWGRFEKQGQGEEREEGEEKVGKPI